MKLLTLTDAYLENYTLDHFRTAVINAFQQAGTQVETVIANKYLDSASATFYTQETEATFYGLTQGPWDAIFNFNRAGMLPSLSFCQANDPTPVMTWYIDSPQRVPKSLRHYKSAEHVFIPDDTYLPKLATEPGLADDRVHYLGYATTLEMVKPTTLDPTQLGSYKADFSFVGTFFSQRPLLQLMSSLNAQTANHLFELIEEHTADYHRPMAELVAAHGLQLASPIFDEGKLDVPGFLLRAIDDYMSSQLRVEFLSAISDLNLKIYGNPEWVDAASKNLNVLKRFMFREANPQELPYIYRASKILLNICHVQAQSGLPFRVFDIMGSGGFLLSEYREDLARLFVLDQEAVAFRTPEELRQKAIYYLQHEDRGNCSSRSAKNPKRTYGGCARKHDVG